MPLDLVSDVNHLASSKLFGKSILVQLHLSIMILSEVSAQTLDVIPDVLVLSCITCTHMDEDCVQVAPLEAEQPQLPQPFLGRRCSSPSASLSLLQELQVSLVLRNPKVATAFQTSQPSAWLSTQQGGSDPQELLGKLPAGFTTAANQRICWKR